MSDYQTYTPPAPVGPAKPGKVQAIAIMTIISGALNIMTGASWSVGMLFGIFTIICIPITILPAVLGIFEILYGVKLLSNPPRPAQPSMALAILEICSVLFVNVASLVIGILALVFYNEPDVKAYFARINGQAS
jgi:hypothetical protein